MKQRNRTTTFRPNRKLLSCALASCLAMAAPQVMAQSTSATLRGAVTADSTITVTNVDTGLTRTAKASNGSYNIGGLPPGTYRIDVNAGGQTSSRAVTLAVGQTATLNLQDAPPVSAPPLRAAVGLTGELGAMPQRATVQASPLPERP